MFILMLACNGPESTPGPGVAAQVIGPDGGSITSDDGQFTLEIPAGALSEDTEITVEHNGGLSYEMGPDGLEFATPALATLSMPLSETGLDDGEYLSVPALVSVSGDTVEPLDNAAVVFDETFVATADVAHFSAFELQEQGVRIRSLVIPGFETSNRRFDVPVGGKGTTTLEVVTTNPDVSQLQVTAREPSESVTLVQTGEAVWGLDASGRQLVDPVVFECTQQDTSDSIERTFELSFEDVRTAATLRLAGVCRGANTPAELGVGGTIVGRNRDGLPLVADRDGVFALDPDTGERTYVITSDDPFEHTRSKISQTALGGYIVISSDGIKTFQDDTLDAFYDEQGFEKDSVAVHVYEDGSVLVAGQSSRYAKQVSAFFIDADGEAIELGVFESSDPDRIVQAVEARITDRDGRRVALYVGYDLGLDLFGDVEEPVTSTPTDTVDCGPGGACVTTGDGLVTGHLWTDPDAPGKVLNSFELAPGVVGDMVDAAGRSVLPIVVDGQVVFITIDLGTTHLYSAPLGTDCEPDGVTALPDGRAAVSCGDKVVVTEPLETNDLDDLVACQGDLWEDWDPQPGIPLSRSDVTGEIGLADASDRFADAIDIPEDCAGPEILVSVQTLSGPANASLDVVEDGSVRPPDGVVLGTPIYVFDADPGTSRLLDFEIVPVYDGTEDCIGHSVAASVECDPTADANEDDDTPDDVDPIELGDGESIVFNDLTIDPKDPDVFGITLPGACDVEGTVTDERDDLDVSSFAMLAQGDYALTTLAEAEADAPNAFRFSFSSRDAGDHYVTLESLFASYSDYSLELTADCPFDCYRDIFEPNNTFDNRDVYYDKYVGSVWGTGDVMTVSESDTDWWETPISNFGCSTGSGDTFEYLAPDLQWTVSLLDGEDDAELHMNVTNRQGQTLVDDATFTSDGVVLVADAIGKYPYETEIYVELWGEGGCVEFELEYEVICQ